ncbi:MAG: penicillin-binding protein 1C [Hydrococcus sp. C42_A2020_068]|nr:penicillin-binding protein 1C [Hydrococcus sp. C42_A2020_068]
MALRKILGKTRAVLVLLLAVLIVRSLPYLAPIRASDLVREGVAIEFSDRRGLPLGTILSRDQNHTAVVPLQQISPQFIHAILAAEDGRFYQHGALDMRAIARSLLQAIQAKRIVSGASTITMQLARMLEPAPRTFSAKIREIWLSWRIAAGTNKDDILEAYINRLPMGGNIYGVEAASHVYFGIPAADLNLSQASLLAAIPNNPNYLNPYDYWEPLKKRQRYVLDRMVEDGYINRSQRDRAYEEVVVLQPRQQGIIAAPHFLFWVASQLPKEHPSQIQTTIDRPLQQFVEAQVKDIVRSLAPHNVHQAAAIVIDNRTGEILAYVGSTDYFAQTRLGRNDGVQSLRQPGSTLKPFLYQLALEKHLIRPNTVLADVPTHYAIPGAKLYSPKDYSETFQGPVRIRIALANSLNVPAVRVLEKVGVAAFLERLHQLGFEHLKRDPEYYGLGLTLGSGEVSLWELARAYYQLSVISKGGYGQGNQSDSIAITLNPPVQLPVISSIISPSPLISSSSWSLVTDMLSDRYARAKSFGVESVLNLPFPAAVKTGTSSNFRDTWTVGFTTDYTVATWVGNFDGEPMKQVSGVTGAAPLWNRIMLHLHEKREPASFPSPPGMVKRPICALSGLKPTAACPSVVQEYFYPEDLSEYESHPDTFYQTVSAQKGQYRLNLPREYDEWLAKQPQSSNLMPSALKILSPNTGDYFLINPADPQRQRLEFKLGGIGNQPVEWRLNGEKIATNSSSSLFWQLRPGNWTLDVKSGEMMDRVTFQVRVGEKKNNRRGFSTAAPANTP